MGKRPFFNSAKRASQPMVTVSHDFSASPYTFPGFRPVWCSEHHFTGPWPCDCEPGPQIVLMNPGMVGVPAPDVVVTGGARGGMKTQSLLAIAAFRGNPDRLYDTMKAGGTPRQVDLMYVAHKNYRGLILRPQAADLTDILDRAEELYTPYGAKITRGTPPMAEWPISGAKIIFGHFLEDGWKKYVGPEYQFIGIDQLEMMPFEETMHRIAGSCRSKWPELHPMILGTFNPGGGDDMRGAPGQGWIMEYFRIDAYLDKRVPKYAAIRDEHKKLRMFIPSQVTDNPYFRYQQPELTEDKQAILCFSCQIAIPVPMPARPKEESNICPSCQGKLMDDGNYLKWLQSIEPEGLRNAWLHGDMRALSGQYFRDWRPTAPYPGEPENALHVYNPETTRLEDWWHCWGSIDWGYIHPTDIQFHRKSPKELGSQVFTFKEISIRRVEPFELGVLIARECRPIFEGFRIHNRPESINFYLSPDAYGKRTGEDNTIASQIAAGIRQEYGPGSVFIAELNDEEKALRDSGAAKASMLERRSKQHAARITLVPANNNRTFGWMHMQTMMRFRPLKQVSKPDVEFANRLYLEKGLVAYKEYHNLPEFKQTLEVLPKWQISKACKELISCIPRAMHKPSTSDIEKFDATETAQGDDPIDCARYGLYSEDQQGEIIVPLEKRIDDRMAELQLKMPGLSEHSLFMARQRARYIETVGRKKKTLPFEGANRIAARRALIRPEFARFTNTIH